LGVFLWARYPSTEIKFLSGVQEYFGLVKQKGVTAKGWGAPTSIPLTTLTQQLTRTLTGR